MLTRDGSLKGEPLLFGSRCGMIVFMGEEEPKTIDYEDIYEYGIDRQDLDTWRWGYSCRHLLCIDGKRYLTERIRYHSSEGCDLNADSRVKIYPAEIRLKEVWVISDEV